MRRQALFWIALQLAASWPNATWAWRRMTDGSDEPLGAAALIALLVLVMRRARSLRAQPDLRWIALSAMLTVLSTTATFTTPPLAAALIGVLAVASSLCAWLPAGIARLPFAGLAVLALPLLSSLQFYVGYPLRLVIAQLSTCLLQLCGLDAVRTGAAMTVGGRLVIVDAPCSGVQMAWMAYFTAFVIAGLVGVRDRELVRRLPWVGAFVLAGNAVRNAVLVSMEAASVRWGELVHQGIGLVLLAAVCMLVLRLIGGVRTDARAH